MSSGMPDLGMQVLGPMNTHTCAFLTTVANAEPSYHTVPTTPNEACNRHNNIQACTCHSYHIVALNVCECSST